MDSIYGWLVFIPLAIAVFWYGISYWRYADLYKAKRGQEMWQARGRGRSPLSIIQDDPELEAGRRVLNRRKWIVLGIMLVTAAVRIALEYYLQG